LASEMASELAKMDVRAGGRVSSRVVVEDTVREVKLKREWLV